MNDSIEKSVYMIQSEMFDIRENITDGPNLIINNELLNIHRRNKELEIQLEEHGKKTNELEAQNKQLKEEKLELEKDVRLDLATDIVYDIANFADDAFSSGSSIDVVANEKNLELLSTDYLDKNGLDVNRSKPKNNLLSDKVFLEVLWNSEKDGNLSINETEDGKFFALSLFDDKKEFLPSLDEVKTKLEVSWKQSKAIEETLNKAGKLSAADDFIKFANENQMNVSQIIGASQNDPSYPRPQIIKSLFGIELSLCQII